MSSKVDLSYTHTLLFFSSSDAISETRALTEWVGDCCIHDQAAQKFIQGKKNPAY